MPRMTITDHYVNDILLFLTIKSEIIVGEDRLSITLCIKRFWSINLISLQGQRGLRAILIHGPNGMGVEAEGVPTSVPSSIIHNRRKGKGNGRIHISYLGKRKHLRVSLNDL